MITQTSPWIGAFAREAIEENRKGNVAGVTSKGMFLLFDRKSVFITPIKEKSPFNVYLNVGKNFYEGISTGNEVIYSAGEILFPEGKRSIEISHSEVWIPPRVKTCTLGLLESRRRVSVLLQQIISTEPNDKGFLSIYQEKPNILKDADKVKQKISGLQQSYQERNLRGIMDAADGLFGLGGGLTPSGDDLLTGFLLYHTRLEKIGPDERKFVRAVGKALTETAYEKTTWISANRIEAACKGWSEAIFLEVLDHLYDEPSGLPENAVERLLGFGHSSGVDTLLGVATAVGAI